MRRAATIALAVLTATATGNAAAASKRDAWAPYAQPPLIWETIPDWQSTPESKQVGSTLTDPEALVLPPDSGVWFVLEKNSVLRLDGVDPAEESQLEVRQADALGLYAPLPLIGTDTDHSLVAREMVRDSRLIWIQNTGETEADFRLLSGTLESPGALPRWLQISNGGDGKESDWIARFPQSEWQRFTPLDESGLSLELEGPATYELQFRQRVTAKPFPARDYVDVSVDDDPSRRFYLHFRPDRDHRYRAGGDNILLSRPERVYLPVESDAQGVKLSPGFSGWLQVREVEDRTWLDDSRPWGVAETDVATGLIQAQSLEQNQIEDKLTGQWSPAPDPDALSFWTEPSVLDGSRYHFFRTLWPTTAVGAEAIYPVRTMLDARQTALEWFFEPASEEQLADNYQPSDGFIQLHDAGAAYEFPVPASGRGGDLRVRLRKAAPGTELTVETGSHSHRLIYRPDLTIPTDTRLNQRDANPLLQGAQLKPGLISEVVLSRPGGGESVVVSSNQPDTRLQIAVEEPNAGKLTETELLSKVTTDSRGLIARSWLLNQRSDDMDPRHWHDSEFVRRWLNSRAASFRSQVSPPLRGRAGPDKLLEHLDDLIALGETGLARSLARGVLVFPPDPEGGNRKAVDRLDERAFSLLKNAYIREGSDFNLQTLLAHRYLSTGSPSSAVAVAEQLYKEGYLKALLRLSMGIDQSRLDSDERQKLLALIREAGISSEWTRLANALIDEAPAENTSSFNLPPVWLDASQLVTGERKTRWVYNPDLDRLFTRHQTAPDLLLTLEMEGPAELAFSVNLLHGDAEAELNDWLTLDHNKERYDIPLLGSRVRGTLTPAGDTDFRPGSQQRVTLSLSEGHHAIRLNTRQHEALVGVEILSPNHRVANYFKHRLSRPRSEPVADSKLQPGKLIALQPAADRSVSDDSAESVEAALVSIFATPDFQSKPALIARANKLAADWPEHNRINQLLSAINEQQFWTREELITDSAGLVAFDSDGWAPESDFLESRYPLLGSNIQPGESLLFGRNGRGFQLSPQRTTEYRLRLRLDKVAFQQVPAVTVALTENDRAIRRVELSETASDKTVRFTLEPGQHKLTLKLDNPTSGHWVFARLQYREGGQRGPWTTAINNSQRFYHLVTRQEPLTLYLDQPAWLRVESFDGSRWHSKTFYQQEEGYRTFRREELNGRYVRVYSLRHKPERKPLPPAGFAPELPKQTVEADIQTSPPPVADAALIYEAFAPESPDSGTHGAFAQLRQRPDFDTRDTREEKFLEAGYRYRRLFDEERLHWQSDNFARLHQDSGIQLIGTKNWFSWRPDRRHWRLGATVNGFWQLDSNDDQTGSSASGSVFGAGRFPIGERLEIRHRLTLFHHWLSEQNSGSNRDFDNDVFSSYKRDHRRGLDWQETLAYSPFNDTRLAASLGVRSNDDFNPFSPDRFSLNLDWQQYWHGYRFELGTRTRFLQEDDDRSDGRTQTLLRAEASRFHWRANGQRFEAGLGAGYDLDSEDLQLSLSVSWDFAGQRRLRDFRPETLPFREREQAVANQRVHHNSISTSDHEE